MCRILLLNNVNEFIFFNYLFLSLLMKTVLYNQNAGISVASSGNSGLSRLTNIVRYKKNNIQVLIEKSFHCSTTNDNFTY